MASTSYLPPGTKPPRPPNAWIIYRSDKLQQLAPPPGQKSPPQADVSRTIAKMWRQESDPVREHYERLAEKKKAEHAIMYPNYRFQPMKKEEKERLREMKKAEKERAKAEKKGARGARYSPYGAAYMCGMPMAPPPPIYQTQMHQSFPDPSPPVSAAASPEDGGMSVVSQRTTPEASTSQRRLSPRYSQKPLPNGASSGSFLLDSSQPAQPPPAWSSAMMPPPFPANPAADSTQSYSMQKQPSQEPANDGWALLKAKPSPSSSDPPASAPPSPWEDSIQQFNDANEANTSYDDSFDYQNKQMNMNDYLQFDIPNLPNQNNAEWGRSNGDGQNGMFPNMSSLSGFYEVEDTRLQDLLASMAKEEIELAVASQPQQPQASSSSSFQFDQQSGDFSNFAQSFFGDFDFSGAYQDSNNNNTGNDAGASIDPTQTLVGHDPSLYANTASSSTDQFASSSTQPQGRNFSSQFASSSSPEQFASSSTEQFASSSTQPQGRNFSSFGSAEMFQQYVDLDQNAAASSSSTSTPAFYPEYVPTQPYVPPAGASHHGTRRVAASWKPRYVPMPDSPVEHSPQVNAPWSVPSN